MKPDPSMTQDKFELHYRQQLSALVDGELAADESRFLLRRLEHDEELSGCHERWQLLGDVLRGAGCAPAPADFVTRVREAMASEPSPLVEHASNRGRTGLRWSGGIAMAASVAVLALFMAREYLPRAAVTAPEPMAVVATTAQLPAAPQKPISAGPDRRLTVTTAAVPGAALAVASKTITARRGSATRSQQAARGLVSRQDAPERRLAAAQATPVSGAVTTTDPFAHPVTLQAKPWPRSVIAGDSAINVSFGRQPAFYPFEPTLPTPATQSGASELPLP